MTKTVTLPETLVRALIAELNLAESVYESCQIEFGRHGDEAYVADLAGYRTAIQRVLRKLERAMTTTLG